MLLRIMLPLVLTWNIWTPTGLAESDYLAHLQSQAREQKLGHSTAWKKLLFYSNHLIQSDTSMIDSAAYFNDPQGDKNPEAELLATLAAFFKPIAGADDTHPQCFFRARYQWLKERLKFNPARLPEHPCPKFTEWFKEVDYTKASLVFSSYFVNSPSSMWGHTFMHMHRRVEPGKAHSELLDDAVNFAAAVPPGQTGPIYMLRGAFGFYPGKFMLARYYHKIQEYNNYESRDLWEYDLDLTPEELRWMMVILWEVGPHWMDYYYFDENCSFIMLSLIEAARPSVDLTSSFDVWVTPGDTIREVARAPGLMTGVRYRPSSLSRFLERSDALSGEEREIVIDLVRSSGKDDSAAMAELHERTKESQAKILDAVLEFIDFDEDLAAEKQAVKHALLHKKSLAQRASTGIAATPLTRRPEAARPDLGHDTGRMGIGGGIADQVPFVQFEWRPSLHDITFSRLGYSDELGIKFLDVAMRAYKGRRGLLLAWVTPIDILSTAPLRPLMTPLSWHLQVGYRSLGECPDQDPGACHRTYARGGAGWTFKPLGDPWMLFAIPLIQLGTSTEDGQVLSGGPGALAGTSLEVAPWLKLSVLGAIERRFGESISMFRELSGDIAIGLPPKWELHGRGAWRHEQPELSLALLTYF